MTELHEECGIFSIYDPNKSLDVAHITYSALYALQHRGQQSSGIAVNKEGKLYCHRDSGLANEVFNEMVLNYLQGNYALGHVRYSVAGMEGRENAQPIVCKYYKGQLAIAYNGNIINSNQLRGNLEESGAMFQTQSDTEIMAYIIAHERLKENSTEQAISNAMNKIVGAYSAVMLCPNKMIAFRDPNGFRPLCIGTLGNAYIFASESCAIDAVSGKFLRNVQPGEIVIINEEGIKSNRSKCDQKGSLCIFEHIYFARPDSVIDGQSVHKARLEAGRCLARRFQVEADIVIGVPDSGLDAAIGYSYESNIPYAMGLIKNRYIGRTFIQTKQNEREGLVKLKLNAMSSVVKEKRVVVVDDSIVRGTTTANLIKLIREAGASQVHIRISSPPFLNPCYFGTDISSRDKLIAYRMSVDEICKTIGADTLAYLEIEDLKIIVKDLQIGFCDACFTAKYPIHISEKE